MLKVTKPSELYDWIERTDCVQFPEVASTSGTVTAMFPANANRIALWLGITASSAATLIGFGVFATRGATRFVLPPFGVGNGPYVLKAEDFGSLVQEAISIVQMGASNVSVGGGELVFRR